MGIFFFVLFFLLGHRYKRGCPSMLKSMIYLILSLATVFYALPRFQFLSNDFGLSLFSIAWVLFALIVVGAHLDHLLQIDEGKRKRLAQLKKYEMWKREQKIWKSQRRMKKLT